MHYIRFKRKCECFWFHDIIITMKPKFIVDINVGKLARRLRMLGFDTLFINGVDDNELVRMALKEGRVLLTKDTGIMQRKIIFTEVVKAILIESDDVRTQLTQVIRTLGLGPDFDPFSLCMECNVPLLTREKAEVRELVPPYVFGTQENYMQCPNCGRVYWRGTHWERMVKEIGKLGIRL